MVRGLRKTFLRSIITTTIKKATTLGIAPSQKTNYNLGNFYVDDC